MPTPPPPPSNWPIYAFLGMGLALTVGCVGAFLGPALLPVLAVVFGVILVGATHYWLWGRGLSEGQDRVESEE